VADGSGHVAVDAQGQEQPSSACAGRGGRTRWMCPTWGVKLHARRAAALGPLSSMDEERGEVAGMPAMSGALLSPWSWPEAEEGSTRSSRAPSSRTAFRGSAAIMNVVVTVVLNMVVVVIVVVVMVGACGCRLQPRLQDAGAAMVVVVVGVAAGEGSIRSLGAGPPWTAVGGSAVVASRVCAGSSGGQL